MNTFERHEPQNPTPRATEPLKVYYDCEATRIGLTFITHFNEQMFAVLTAYCAGVDVTVELDRDAAQALGKALIEAWIGATP